MINRSDLLIIGAGPGGYELAAEAAREGLVVTLIERNQLGGTCLNRGCIPTKALCRSAEVAATVADAAGFGVDVAAFSFDYARAAARKDEVVSALREGVEAMLGGVTMVKGDARFVEATTVAVGDDTYTAPRIVIATGSEPARLNVPGAEFAVTSDELLSMTTLPRRVTIIGGGVIGLEFASILSAFGVSVTVIEYCKEVLPGFDKDIAKRLRTALSRRGVDFITGASVTAITPSGLTYEHKGVSAEVEAGLVVMAVGRRAVIPDGVVAAGMEVDRRGIKVNDRFETNLPGVYAVGDVNGLCQLAHAATAQSLTILGRNVNLDVIPAAVFTMPECAMVGMTEQQCKDAGIPYKAVKTLFRANGKALSMGETDGLVKMITDTRTRMILGCHICGPHAADIIQEVATVMSARLPVDVVAGAIHAHPTLSEAVAAAAALSAR